jgi:predicted AAA+ superfamily ATPase
MLYVLGARQSGKTRYLMDFLKEWKGEKVIIVVPYTSHADCITALAQEYRVKNKIKDIVPISQWEKLRGQDSPIFIDEIGECLKYMLNNKIVIATDTLDKLQII